MHKQTEPDDQVKLKAVMGIRPGIYLTVFYSIILLGVLFFILIFPGLRNPGSLVVYKTEPAGAALRVDDTYMGTSPCMVFVSRGAHTLEAVLPGFETESVIREIPGRIFGSLLFPERYPLEFSLTTNDPAGVFAIAAADYAAWTFAGEPTAIWQIPLALSEGAYRAGPYYNSSMEELLRAASRFAVTRAAIRDIVRSKMLLDNRGFSPSPAGITGSVYEILDFLSENPGSAEWLCALLPSESAAVVRASNWYKNEFNGTGKSPAPRDFGQPPARQIELAGLSFTGVNGGVFIQSEPSFHEVAVKSFMVSQTAVPPALYENFLYENPSWRDDTDGVSWYAAQAFCQWLGARLPPSMASWEIRLPTEAEWSAAKITETWWEWCADPYVPLPFIAASVNAVNAVSSPERSLRKSDARASLPPDFSSPFVSFRPVIAEKNRDN